MGSATVLVSCTETATFGTKSDLVLVDIGLSRNRIWPLQKTTNTLHQLLSWETPLAIRFVANSIGTTPVFKVSSFHLGVRNLPQLLELEGLSVPSTHGDRMSRIKELVYLLSTRSEENPKTQLIQFLKDCRKDRVNASIIINTPIAKYGNRTSVHLAVVSGLHECLDILLVNGGDPNSQSGPADMCQTPLHIAAKKGYVHCLEILLLKHYAWMDVPDSDDRKPKDNLLKGRIESHRVFDHAAAKNNPAPSQDLIQVVEALHQLVERGNLDKFQEIYDQLPEEYKDLALRWNDLNQQTLLYKAVQMGSNHIVQHMLEMSHYEPLHNLHSFETPLVAACRNRNHELVFLLLEHSPGLLFPYKSHDICLPLSVAATNGDEVLLNRILNVLIESGSYDKEHKLNLDFYDSDGCTPLLNACIHGHLEIVQMLLRFAKDNAHCVALNVNTVHKVSGRPPLHEAAQKGVSSIVEALLLVGNINVHKTARPSSDTHNHILASSPNTLIAPLLASPSSTPLSVNDHISSASMTTAYSLTTSNDQQASSPCSDSNSFIELRIEEAASDSDLEAQSQALDSASVDGSQVSVEDAKPYCIYLHIQSGKLAKLRDEPPSDYHPFERLKVSSLVVACAYGHKDIVSLLLKHGSRDESSFACRIAHLVQRNDLIQLILSYHCSIVSYHERNPMTLMLDWDRKRLPVCEAEFLSTELEFFPSIMCDEVISTKFNTTTISKVCLNGNYLLNVPIELFQLPNVVLIDLSRNELDVLPTDETQDHSSGWKCPRLQELDLDRNALDTLPTVVWCQPKLKSLVLSHNRFRAFDNVEPKKLSKSLADIDLSYNELEVIPQFLFTLPQLNKLVVHHNQIESLPEAVWNCKLLKELDVSYNHLKTLPLMNEEDETDSLVTSTMYHGKPNIRRVRNLPMCAEEQTLTVRSIRTHQNSLPISWNVAVTPLEYSSLHVLKISHNQFEAFPNALACLAPNLTELDISDNLIKSINIQFVPPLMSKFTADNCQIEVFGMNSDLGMLKCHHGIQGLPCQHRCHRSLLYLKNLSLRSNRLQSFELLCQDPERAEADQDERTFLSTVHLENLLYPFLQNLDLSKNNLHGCFNPNIGHQLHLRSVMLSGNPELTALPNEFAYLKDTRQFESLAFDNCPNLLNPPREYHSLGTIRILTLMKSNLKDTVPYRTIKLFVVGEGHRGKTTLLKRLRDQPTSKGYNSTVGIDIEEWIYPSKSKQTEQRKSINFLAWDFAGQDSYHTSHQCFYSRRSMYLALFRLCDGVDGINELEAWLRNIKIRAPGSPVIIICTHLDKVTKQEAEDLENEAWKKYAPNTGYYPDVVDIMSVNCKEPKSFFGSDAMETIRERIYNVASHLQMIFNHDGTVGLIYKEKMPEDDPKALFQQKIPTSYLELQSRVLETAKSLKEKNSPRLLNEQDFYDKFIGLFTGDSDELDEAVNFLSLQGTMLHFNDRELKSIYFLDPQWLAKLMAIVIKPDDGSTDIVNGVAVIEDLFKQHKEADKHLQDVYINLLEKFDVVRRLEGQQIIIPSLIPDRVQYPKTNDFPSKDDLPEYKPPLRRLWFSNSIPNGFWSRLICRITSDKRIEKLLGIIVNGDRESQDLTTSWIKWRCGIAFVHDEQTLCTIQQDENQKLNSKGQLVPLNARVLQGFHRIGINVYVNEWLEVINGVIATGRNKIPSQELLRYPYITSLATQFMIRVDDHLKALAITWFPGMIISPKKSIASYAPCWKCFAKMDPDSQHSTTTTTTSTSTRSRSGYRARHITYVYDVPVYCFSVDECLTPTALDRPLKCPAHGRIDAEDMLPDLVFLDTDSSKYGELKIENTDNSKPLGTGGYGFVCKGKLLLNECDKSQDVAVKIFLDNMDNLRNRSTKELLSISRDPKHLAHAYREIRQEVSFLSSLENPYLAQVFCARTTPYMCFVLELAPMGSLYSVLKKHKVALQPLALQPLTLKATALQIAKGLEYLHRYQMVHLDMKSSNVLVWAFPSPQESEDKVKKAGNVWVKIADYGISQVSTRLKFKVGVSPPGTPGYMAPELFEQTGQVISADKVDVFSYGMTLYELLSFQPPFSNVDPPLLRKEEIKQNRRPPTEHHAILPFQELMSTCWKHKPDERPNMKQIIEFIDRSEFDKLRNEIPAKPISCVCICRVLPQNEETITQVLDETSSIDELSISDNYSTSNSCSVRRRNFLVGSFDSVHIGVSNFGEERYSTIPNMIRSRGASMNTDTTASARDAEGGCPASTQIWTYDGQGFLQIFVWYDGTTEHTYSCSFKTNEVSAMCSVRNSVWMGDNSGVISIKSFNGRLKRKFKGELKVLSDDETVPISILDMCHVEETSTVLVSTKNLRDESGEIWLIEDRIKSNGLHVFHKLHQPACNHLIKVKTPDELTLWGTMNNCNRLLFFTQTSQQECTLREELEVDREFKRCSFMVHTRFMDRDQTEHCHVWVVDCDQPFLVAIDVKTKAHYCKLDCIREFRVVNNRELFKVTCLESSGKAVLVGTNMGTVGIIDAERKRLVRIFKWHVETVQAILIMPDMVIPCMCAEVPFPEEHNHSTLTMDNSPGTFPLLAVQSQDFPTSATMEDPFATAREEPTTQLDSTSSSENTTWHDCNERPPPPIATTHPQSEHSRRTESPFPNDAPLAASEFAPHNEPQLTTNDHHDNTSNPPPAGTPAIHSGRSNARNYFLRQEDNVMSGMVSSIGIGRSYVLNVLTETVSTHRPGQESTILLSWKL